MPLFTFFYSFSCLVFCVTGEGRLSFFFFLFSTVGAFSMERNHAKLTLIILYFDIVRDERLCGSIVEYTHTHSAVIQSRCAVSLCE